MPPIVQNVVESAPLKISQLSDSVKDRISKRDTAVSVDAKENEIIHGTWQMEHMILSYIEAGDVEGIQRYFEMLSKQQTINAGILAEDPLRQEKNLFIGLVALVGKTAGINGGMDVEDAYRLIDIYTQECEKASSVDEIFVLRYTMIIEFTERVRKCKTPHNISKETAKAIHYMNEHICQDITLDEIADHIHISRSALTKHFRKELNQSVVEYLTHEKIKEAQRLLLYSDMTISEIALYLNFSNQPYFQTAFKKAVGMTPLQYRRTVR